LAISEDPSQQQIFKQLLQTILQHFSEQKACVSLLSRMYNNRTLAPYISVDSIIDFVIVKILTHIEIVCLQTDVDVRIELSEYLDLLISMQDAVTSHRILKRIQLIGQGSRAEIHLLLNLWTWAKSSRPNQFYSNESFFYFVQHLIRNPGDEVICKNL
jgi:hypothetical protein